MFDREDEITQVIPRRILVAEDNEVMRAMLARWLGREGYEVVEARDGGELLAHVHESILGRAPAFDLVISDVRMPGVGGIELLEQLRALGVRTPVILMSAFADEALHEYAYEAGATAFIDKPFEMYDLCTAARYWAHQGVDA